MRRATTPTPARPALALALVLALGSCHRGRTQIVLRVDTDLAQGPGRELSELRLAVRAADEAEPRFERKDLLGIAELSAEEIELVLDTADSFCEVATRPIKKVPTLRGKTVLNLFFEASTRTRSSFEIAEKRLSADSVNFSSSGSSLSKGETIMDTALTLEAMAPDIVVIRHSHPRVPHMLAARLDSSVVNAGDGAHEHPTQALLDALTIRHHKGRIEGLNVSIVGDIEHSRVVRSNLHLLTKLSANVTLAGPRTSTPERWESFCSTASPVSRTRAVNCWRPGSPASAEKVT